METSPKQSIFIQMRDLKLSKLKPNFDKSIRVTVPAKVAFDLPQLNKITGEVLKELGCPGCHSGFDIRFDIERQFVFNEKLERINRF